MRYLKRKCNILIWHIILWSISNYLVIVAHAKTQDLNKTFNFRTITLSIVTNGSNFSQKSNTITLRTLFSRSFFFSASIVLMQIWLGLVLSPSFVQLKKIAQKGLAEKLGKSKLNNLFRGIDWPPRIRLAFRASRNDKPLLDYWQIRFPSLLQREFLEK